MNTSSKPGSRKGRRNYDVALKKQLAIAACEPGVSVARLALEHGINANMLHKWRREHLAADAGGSLQAELLAVRVKRPGNELVQNAPHTPLCLSQLAVPKPGVIEIRCGAVIVRMEGAVDGATLAQVLRHLHP